MLPSLLGHVYPVRSLRDAYARQAVDDTDLGHWSGPPQMVEAIARAVGTRPGHRVLDVGCGVGGPARRLAAVVGCRVVGVDILERVVAWGSRRGAEVSYVAGDAEALPVGSGVVDQVWMLGVLAHLRDLERAAREMARVLRPGGRVAITEGFCSTGETPRFSSCAPQPWRAVAVGEVCGALDAAGFVAIAEEEWPGGERAHSGDSALEADLATGRLRPRLVVGTRS